MLQPFSDGGRLAAQPNNLLPPHPEGCPMGIAATEPCFVAGKQTYIVRVRYI